MPADDESEDEDFVSDSEEDFGEFEDSSSDDEIENGDEEMGECLPDIEEEAPSKKGRCIHLLTKYLGKEAQDL